MTEKAVVRFAAAVRAEANHATSVQLLLHGPKSFSYMAIAKNQIHYFTFVVHNVILADMIERDSECSGVAGNVF